MTTAELVKLGHTLGGLLALGYVAINRRSSLQRENELLRREWSKSRKRELYLASIIDKHGIEIDEFDYIAMREL